MQVNKDFTGQNMTSSAAHMVHASTFDRSRVPHVI